MLIFATSDKGGTGRSVTGCNVAYRRALLGDNVCYVDFDFGSPTAGAIFGMSEVQRGTTSGEGTHSYLRGISTAFDQHDVWKESDRRPLRPRPPGSGRLVLVPGDASGGEFASSTKVVDRCLELFLRLQEEFDVTIVDLSAGRSYAAEIVLQTSLSDRLGICRWLIFHRWTRQHIIAAAGLLHGESGLLDRATKIGLAPGSFLESVRFVRTAVLDPHAQEVLGFSEPQQYWLSNMDRELMHLATNLKLGDSSLIGKSPFDPLLQWEEQLVTDDDVDAYHVANEATIEAFEDLARQLSDRSAWERP